MTLNKEEMCFGFWIIDNISDMRLLTIMDSLLHFLESNKYRYDYIKVRLLTNAWLKELWDYDITS